MYVAHQAVLTLCASIPFLAIKMTMFLMEYNRKTCFGIS